MSNPTDKNSDNNFTVKTESNHSIANHAVPGPSAEALNGAASYTTSYAADTAPRSVALPAGQWLRAVLGFDAPFGHDGLPTVWG